MPKINSYTWLLVSLLAGISVFLVFMEEFRSAVQYTANSLLAEELAEDRRNAERTEKWADIETERIAAGFTHPVYLTHAGDGSGRVFVVEKAGVIKSIDLAAKTTETFMDISDRVRSRELERGLLSVAFHPSYSGNGRFFVNYTDLEGDTVVSEFKVSDDGSRGDPESERLIIRIAQPAANHNGGLIKFGKDGYLYIGTGDGGSAGDPWGNAQNVDILLGKILRIDIDSQNGYSIPRDNPFTGKEGARDEIWAYGLRNPWRFSFDPETFDLYIADVGQNRWEEINHQSADSSGGENYGWNYFEGFDTYDLPEDKEVPDTVMPVMVYGGEYGCAVTGGYIYRGEIIEDIDGTYFFGDYCTGRVWGLRKNEGSDWEYAEFLDTDISISSFGIDENNEIYITDLRRGRIYRINSVQ